MSESGAKIVRGLLEALLLQSLSRGPRHGYALLKEIEDLAGETPNRNKIYPLLARLEAQGLVERRSAEAEGGRSRTVFALTDAGREELDRLRRLPDPLRGALAQLWPGAIAVPAEPAPAAPATITAPPAAVASPALAPVAPPATVPAGALPYPCPDARVTLEKDPRTGHLAMRLTGCPMGAYTYCPQCPVYKSVDGLRRLTFG